MTRSCCLGCRLRFAGETPGSRTLCPFCGGPLARASAREALGLRLIASEWFGSDDANVDATAELTVLTPTEDPP